MEEGKKEKYLTALLDNLKRAQDIKERMVTQEVVKLSDYKRVRAVEDELRSQVHKVMNS